MSQFKVYSKLQEAVIVFIVGTIATKESMSDLQLAFKVLDKDNNGRLEKQTLINAYRKIFGDRTKIELDKIFERVDIN